MKNDKGQITLESIQEVLSIVTCKEQKLLRGVWRDCRGITDFTNIYGDYWDLKILVSRNCKEEHIFNVQKLLKLLKERRILGHKSIIDITRLENTDAKALIEMLEKEFDQQLFNTIVIVHREDPSKSRKFEG